MAGLAALAVVALALRPLNGAIADFAHLYASEFRLASLDWQSTLALLAISAALGFSGAFLSVKQHLSRAS
jgi:cell division transport system permease protein